MSGMEYLPLRTCPLCEGVGTYQVPDAAREGGTFTEICARCRGTGQVRGQLAEKREEEGDGQ